MTVRYLTAARLATIEARLSARDKEIVRAVGILGVITGEQLRLAYFDTPTKDGGRRSALKVLTRLVGLGVLGRLERRIGGARSGSTGYVYVLGVAGQRLAQAWDGQSGGRARQPYEPGARYILHRLGVAQLFAELTAAHRRGDLVLAEFAGEPDCWRRRIGAFGEVVTLKPDSYVRIRRAGRGLHWFIEVDMATESLPVIANKAEAYAAHYRSGAEGRIMPRVAWIAPDERRVDALETVLTHPTSPAGLHVVVLAEDATETLKGEYL